MAKRYQGAVLDGKQKGKSVIIEAENVETAMAEMTERFGPQFSGVVKHWACGLAPSAAPGPEKYGDE